MDAADQAGGGYSDADITNRVPMARFASPDDIAKAIAFLADDCLSGYINGHTLSVDGGWSGDGSWDSLRLKVVSRIRVATMISLSDGSLAIEKVCVSLWGESCARPTRLRSIDCPALNAKFGGFSN